MQMGSWYRGAFERFRECIAQSLAISSLFSMLSHRQWEAGLLHNCTQELLGFNTVCFDCLDHISDLPFVDPTKPFSPAYRKGQVLSLAKLL